MYFKKKLTKLVIWCAVAMVTLPSSVTAVTTKYHNETIPGHLRISATMWPLVKDRQLPIISAGVAEAIQLDILSRHLGFTYEICPPLDVLSPGFRLPNGSWSGSAGQLEREKVDMCTDSVALDSPKRQVMDISHPVLFAEAAIIIPFPKETSKWIDGSTFQSQVWMALAISAFFTIFVSWIINRITDKRRNVNRRQLSYWVFYFISAQTSHSQGISPRNPSTPLRMVFAVFISGVFIISNYFTASFTSVLSIPILKPSVNSIEELAHSDSVRTLLLKGSNTDEYIMSSTSDPLKKIGDQMRRHPERRILNAFSVEDISTIVKQGYALPLIKSNSESMIETSYRLNKKCLVTLADKTFLPRAQGFTFPKNSKLVPVINYEILLMYQAGLIQYAEIRSTSQRNPCSVSAIKKEHKEKWVALKLGDLFGVFAIFWAGLGLGFISFLFEVIATRLVKAKKKKVIIKSNLIRCRPPITEQNVRVVIEVDNSV